MKKHSFDRRTLLRGFGGAVIGLPLLESLGQQAFAQGAKVAKHFIVLFEHGGTLSNVSKDGSRYDGRGAESGFDDWKPLSGGEAHSFGAIHQPLVPFSSSTLLLRGINGPGFYGAPYNGDHRWSNAMTMTSQKAYEASTTACYGEGPSFEQVLGERLMQRTPTKFSNVMLSLAGDNYGTPFFRAARQPIYGEENPRAAFDRLFTGVTFDGAPTVDPAAARARALKRSILDGTGDALATYKNRLSAADKLTVQAHLEHIRNLEQRIAAAPLPPSASCSKPDVTKTPATSVDWYFMANANSTSTTSSEAMVDVLVTALRCGLTHVAALEIGDLETRFLNPPYKAGYGIGHSLHHAANDTGATGVERDQADAWHKSMLDNRRWRMTLMARLMDALQRTPEGTTNMLDNSVILWTSEFSRGGSHSNADMPVLLGGGAGGYFRSGRHLNFNELAAANPETRNYKSNKSFNNLYTSILNAFGYPDQSFGDPSLTVTTGPLPGLT